jgi:hypothetical protein
MTMSSAELNTYEELKAAWGEKTAKTLMDYIETKADEKAKAQAENLTSKKELSAMEVVVQKVNGEWQVKIADSKSEMIRWMCGFWIAQAITTFGFILLFIKK